MIELWLVRHGETDWNRVGRMQGWSDVPLNGVGREQAKALAGWLGTQVFDSVYSSDLSRAVETARLAYAEPQQTLHLREVHFGEWEGESWHLREDIRSALVQFDGFAAPGGETAQQIRERLERFLAQLPPGRHLCFSHGGVIRALLRQVGAEQPISNCSVVALEWTKRQLLFIRNLEADPYE